MMRGVIYWYRVYWEKSDPENDENTIDFRWSDGQTEDKELITKANLIENLQK